MGMDFIDLRKVQKEVEFCYAHKMDEETNVEQKQKETLIEHTLLCLKYYEKINRYKISLSSLKNCIFLI